MEDALDFLDQDRAFVACIVQEDEIRTVASKGTVRQIRQLPQGEEFISEETDWETRVAFLIAGVREVAKPPDPRE